MLNSFKLNELEKIKLNLDSLENMSDELKADAEFMLEAVKHHPYVLRYAAPELTDNKQFILDAIRINSESFKFASAKLQDDEEVVFAASQQESNLFNWASERLKANDDFKIHATKQTSWYPWINSTTIIKNNFFEGIKSTFAIMYGNDGILKKLDGQEVDPNALKYGLINITFIPQVSNFLINYGYPSKPAQSNPFRYVRDEERRNNLTLIRHFAGIIGLGLQVLRYAMAALATIMVLPLVALVHVCKFPYAYYQQRKLAHLEGHIYHSEDRTNPISEQTTLEKFVARTNSSLNDLHGSSDPKNRDITSYSKENTSEFRYGSLVSRSSILFFRPLDSNTPAHKRAQEALAELEINKPCSL